MDRKTIAFWSMFIGFCTTATISMWLLGDLRNIDVAGSLIILSGFLVCAACIYLWIDRNPREVAKLFQTPGEPPSSRR